MAGGAAGGVQAIEVDGRRVRLTNLDKVLYPATGTTKGEVIDYVARIAPVLLPHAAGRPVTRKRWPEGVEHAPFFAKDLERGAPEWIPRHPLDHSTGAKDYPLVADVATLVYLAQVASLELHVPQWRFDADGRRQHPDRLVLDLDPGPGVGLAECAQVARWVRALLRDIGLDPLPVTSGSKGLHLYAPLDGRLSSDDASALARELALALEADHAELVVSRMAKTERPGRVLIDWSQNSASKTTILPYSLRGRAEPTVAAPRTWDELDDPDLRQLRFDEVLARAATIGDPLAACAPPAPAADTDDLTGALDVYLAKRTAGRTPEPMPASPARSSDAPARPRFVVQEHHASRLHWDLRLERDGVLVSWAVPRGVPLSADRNHLAVMTEPHPLEYLEFSGVIPEGEYGAGSMTIWDTGTYETEKWRDDEVIVALAGQPGGPLGEARIALIRTSGAGEKSQWLLHRMTTDAAPPRRAAHATAAGAAPPSARDRTGDAPMLATAATAAEARAAAARWGAWAEFKWDGIRAVGTWDGRRLQLRSRSGSDITARYPELTGLDVRLGPAPCVVDGELVALDAAGRPSFTRLQNRMHLTRAGDIERERARTPVTLFLFDLLSHGGLDATPLPLADRRALLESAASGVVPAIVVPPVTDDVDDALATARSLALEGVVVKDPRSPYRRGVRSDEWLKVKLTRTQEVVVGAIRPGRGERSGRIGSLLVGIPGPGGLRYAGRVGTGFSERELDRLDALLQPLRTGVAPFVGVPAADAADALWVRPELVGEVEFAELTPGGILRHSRWRGLRSDIAPDDVTREA